MCVRSVAFGILVIAASTYPASAGTVAPKPAASIAHQAQLRPAVAAKPAVAPADEYFGRMKLSILGISNTIHDTKLRESFDPQHAASNFDKLSLAEDALEDWSSKYPHDTWLPGKAYYMSHEFWAMNTADGDREAERCRALLFAHFATSPYSQKARTESAAMFAPPAAPVQVTANSAVAPIAAAASGNSTAQAPSTTATPHP